VLINIIAVIVGFGFLILYTVLYNFSFPLALAMTLTWGFQDAGINCLLNSLLGF